MTAQLHEQIIIDGRPMSMAYCPPLPKGDPRVIDTRVVPGADARDPDRLIGSTACWRGYVGTWEIRDGWFYLVGVRGRFVFAEDRPLLADWFSGVLRVPLGGVLRYVHMGFASVYEQELHILIERGRVVDRRVRDNRGTDIDEQELAMRNLPGGENIFDGDDWGES
jgi:hypothetical protein